MTKHEQYFLEMLEDRYQQFEKFKIIHDNYLKDPAKWQDQFNAEGRLIMTIIREWEKKLCSHSERGQYGVFSSGLADKFWALIRQKFPKIDFVGVKVS
ncbi:hypothetical protein A2Y99_04900 [Candidatus Gottesmanbacteria bacterium RBG_13_37_7]|uniref:Uncharacterized protein n=1 Tax=Candidatus Gottesmanbacteria bacterium RBG_13_37_7 TaxID=1798369 RepID=A0A1F5YGS0_9BACT|nr:MAG: hypothetical protein A2Y99_04900 [Candidatus Gottesmanbacteria bacterium RBG_13_37_7]